MTGIYSPVKRALDIIISLSGLVLLSPLFMTLTVAIRLESPGPVLFWQKRVGIDKSQFTILKFRTMRIDTPKDVPTHLLTNPEQYVTRMGKFLRRTSLDELPQVWNVFCGQMSIVGPRPALWNQDDLIRERDKYAANAVPPGLTGWAQVNGRDELPIALKARLDGEYVRRRGLLFDLKILCMTVIAVIRRDGIREGAERTREQKHR